ncbi:MAG: YibE/F family protein [Sedimentisphaerales bacterium]|nr:YibE/F family protein [Sedimentisphaerales bacterium]
MQLQTRNTHKNVILVVVLSLICIGLVYLPTGFKDNIPKSSRFARGKVLEVDNSDIHQALIVKTGIQELNVELLEGPCKGQTCRAMNHLTGKMEMDEMYVEGRKVLVEYAVVNGKVARAVVRGHYRLHLELMLIILFAALLISLGGWTGAKAILSFVFAALMIWKVMIPLFLKGKDPIWVALLVVAALTSAVCFLVGGVSRKGLATFLGAFSGLLLTCVLAGIFTRKFHLHGAIRPFAETLLYSGFDNLNLTRIFIASVFVASSGAVMDLAMDISAAMHEIMEKKPDIGLIEHIRSGLSIGRSVVGTMTTTLLLAYSGSYIALLMLFMGRGVPVVSMLNKSFVAAEVVNTIVGSFGLVTVAPFTAIAGGLLYRMGKKQPATVGMPPRGRPYPAIENGQAQGPVPT